MGSGVPGGGRTSVRFVPRHAIRVVVNDWDLPIHLQDVGSGGFAIVCRRAFVTGATHTFRFSTERGQAIALVAKAVHCRPINPQDLDLRFLTGWQFMIGTTRDEDAAIQMLLQAATGLESSSEAPTPSGVPSNSGR